MKTTPSATGFAWQLWEQLRRRRQRLDDVLTLRGTAHTLSLARYRLHEHITAAVHQFARGNCLDAGSGRSPYRELLRNKGLDVTSVDIEDRSGNLDILSDIQDLRELPDESFDTVLCTQVLEHVPRPWDAMAALARVLRPQGILILTVPHLSMIHEAPHDYFRYTQFGLASLCKQVGLEVQLIEPTSGIVSFLCHGVSVAGLSTIGSLPGMLWPVWLLNYVLLVRLAGWLDRCVGLRILYPCDFALIARKAAHGEAVSP